MGGELIATDEMYSSICLKSSNTRRLLGVAGKPGDGVVTSGDGMPDGRGSGVFATDEYGRRWLLQTFGTHGGMHSYVGKEVYMQNAYEV